MNIIGEGLINVFNLFLNIFKGIYELLKGILFTDEITIIYELAKRGNIFAILVSIAIIITPVIATIKKFKRKK